MKIFRPVPCFLGSCYLFLTQLSRVEALKRRSFTSIEDWIIAFMVVVFTAFFIWCIWSSLKRIHRSTKTTVSPPDSLRHTLQSVGYLFPRKMREEIYDNSVGDLLQDWHEARRAGGSRVTLKLVFALRGVGLVVITILVGVERLVRKLPLLAELFKLCGK